MASGNTDKSGDEAKVVKVLSEATEALRDGITPQASLALCHVLHALAELGYGRARILECVMRRLRAGRRDYGPLRINTDPRDWMSEMVEELVDAAVYGACEQLRTGGGR